ncbi:unnamed protein product [Anisakis simplex]|uniref:GLOBIN domain-containing protein n=1 Tax=Anisakis simplex TaxID=6269 RepID=A0A0M3JG47_ANISI|nr:unnamed protein product [Anisakis simplex]
MTIVIQAMVDFVGGDNTLADIQDAWLVLGGFCVEQMKIGYKIEFKLQQIVSKFSQKQRLSIDSNGSSDHRPRTPSIN